jgi:hypothetical protein
MPRTIPTKLLECPTRERPFFPLTLDISLDADTKKAPAEA